MAFQSTPADISVMITNASSTESGADPSFVSERRITPTWTVMQLKGKLETMSGIPPGSQRLRIKIPGRPDQWAENDDRTIGEYGLTKGSEIEVGSLPFPYQANAEPFNRSMTLAPRRCGLTSPIYPRSRNMNCLLRHTSLFQTLFWPGRKIKNWAALIPMPSRLNSLCAQASREGAGRNHFSRYVVGNQSACDNGRASFSFF